MSNDTFTFSASQDQVGEFKTIATPWGLYCLKCNKEITENMDERCEYCKEWKVV